MQTYVNAIRNNDPTALTGLWSDDAVYIYSGVPTIQGRSALDSLVHSTFATLQATEVSFQTDEILIDHDLAVLRGTYAENFQRRDGGKLAIRGRLVFIWRREPNGSWKVARGIATDLPAS